MFQDCPLPLPVEDSWAPESVGLLSTIQGGPQLLGSPTGHVFPGKQPLAVPRERHIRDLPSLAWQSLLFYAVMEFTSSPGGPFLRLQEQGTLPPRRFCSISLHHSVLSKLQGSYQCWGLYCSARTSPFVKKNNNLL